MTDHDLRTLLRDLADDLTADDQPSSGVERAWAAGVARSRRGRLAVVGSAAAVAAAVTGIAVLNEPARESVPVPPATQSQTPTPLPSGLQLPGGTTPDGQFEGHAVYWGPTVEQQGRLPMLPDSPLPAEIDLGAPVGDGPIARAVAAFGIGDEEGTTLSTVRLLAEDGTWREIDVSRLEPVADEQGNAFVPLGDASLSPDGARLVFAQPDRLAIYDIPTGTWGGFDWGGVEFFAWAVDPEHLLIPGLPGVRSDEVTLEGDVVSNYGSALLLAGHQPYGPLRRGWIASAGGYYEDAQAYYSVEGVPVPAGTISNPELAAVSVGDDALQLLVWPNAPGDRSKGCCAPATWLPSGEIVFAGGDALVSWQPGTHDFHLVSRIVDPAEPTFVIASWADLSH